MPTFEAKFLRAVFTSDELAISSSCWLCAEGEATVENIALMCKRHNQHEAEKYEEMLVRGMSVSQEDGYPFQNG